MTTEGEAGTVVIAPEITAGGHPCDATGRTLIVSLDRSGVVLPVLGNPAVLQLGPESSGQNVLAWSNWCEKGKRLGAAVQARLNLGTGLRASTTVPYTPTCVSASGTSELVAILR